MKKIKNRAELEAALNDLLIAQSKREGVESFINSKTAEARQRATKELAEYDQQVVSLESAIEIFANEHRDDPDFVLPGQKSIQLRAGILQWNDGKPRVDFRDGFNEELVLAKANELGFTSLVRDGDPSLDKEAVKRLIADETLDDKSLRKLGLKIVQEESFTIKPAKVKLK